ncbi:thiol:disulfide interchange protein DsbA/DsbL [Comamonas flocculans]|uniref:Thiol:disulfide interchange protein n=1 Tax=Comamonas flocculans TaxID=2597701 RepID=A0A5B8RW50_9BURK|nr:thiol:disulfide interchange protein DsbA/DsbL [Comamonas flocculans]QEA12914.1 thiol:disulfide interchange protein DsbA/DsbL [Comamonas flocculans]
MNRRDFSLAASAALTLSAGLAVPAHAKDGKFEEGIEYLELKKPALTEAPKGQIEVVEFFWYSCPHCNAFEPSLSAWKNKLPDYVFFRRVPVAFNSSFVPQQKLYYALEGMDKVNELHARVFRAVHVERLPLNKDELIFDWVAKQGVDAARFKQMYTSFTVANQVRRATELQAAYQVEGVPSMGVAGRYYTDGTLTGSMATVLQVVDHLVQQQRKA